MPVPPPFIIALGGFVVLLVLVVQLLIGYRKIKFKGKTHLKVHKSVAWAMLALAVVHALGGVLYLGIIG